ncbi:MAG TPA: hypothetical protein VMG37_04785 [Solirubrobacteraceae bacterium]|nr:hypothetical protein [Solirubrobacteraceae bacterium]
MGTPLGVTGGGGFGVVAFFDGFFFVVGFLPFSTFVEPLDRALPDESVVPLPVGFVVVVLVLVVGDFEVDVDVVEEEDVVGFGLGFDDAGVVEVEGEVEVEVVCGCVLVVTVAAGVVAVTGGQDCATFVIGRFTGSGSDDGGVPGATFWNVNCWPPATVIVTVQPSAEATGMAARPITATMHPMVTAAIVSFRLLNTVANSSRGAPRANSSQLRSQLGLEGRYWLPPGFAIRNRRCGGCLV